TVNVVCPGPADTPLFASISEDSPKLRSALERAIPLRRLAQPEDLANAVAFLASPASRYITGQTLSVSGGLTMARPRSRTPPPRTLLRTAVTDRIGTLTLHRPEQRNALNTALLAELTAVLDAWEADDRVQGVILTGSGEKAFAAGADISEVASWDLAEGLASP